MRIWELFEEKQIRTDLELSYLFTQKSFCWQVKFILLKINKGHIGKRGNIEALEQKYFLARPNTKYVFKSYASRHPIPHKRKINCAILSELFLIIN